MAEYEFITYKVVWYAELGYTDGCGIGTWDGTSYSKPFPTKEEALQDLADHPDTVPDDCHYHEIKWKSPASYGDLRVRRAEERVL